MLRKTIAAAVVAATSIVIAPGVAQADTQGCVTHNEYQHIDRGMTKAQVTRIFDTNGHRTSASSFGGNRDEFRSYKVCSSWGSPRWSDVSINFDNYMNPRHRLGGMRVYGKSNFITR